MSFEELRTLLAPYAMRREDGHAQELSDGRRVPWYVVDVPPPIARQVLEVVDRDVDDPEDLRADARPNGQPPAAWLIEQADVLDGKVSGHVRPHVPDLRIDGIQVNASRGRDLAHAVQAAFPAGVSDWDPPLHLATGYAWTSWDADGPVWEGLGVELLQGTPHPSRGMETVRVVGLWWD